MRSAGDPPNPHHSANPTASGVAPRHEALVALRHRLPDPLRLARADGRLLADRDRRVDPVWFYLCGRFPVSAGCSALAAAVTMAKPHAAPRVTLREAANGDERDDACEGAS